MNSEPDLSWNLGGWLGSQLGGSAWMLVAGLLAMPRDMGTALEVLGIFVLANACGFVLWQRRDAVSALAGMQILLAVVGGASCAAVYLLDKAGIFEIIQSGGKVAAVEMYLLILFIILGLMLMFYLRFGRK